MEKQFLEEIKGKIIEVFEFKLESTDADSELNMQIIADGHIYALRFSNVSALNIRDFSFPFQIEGFEILGTASRGWQKTYIVRDYEEDKIDFFCEDYDIRKIN